MSRRLTSNPGRVRYESRDPTGPGEFRYGGPSQRLMQREFWDCVGRRNYLSRCEHKSEHGVFMSDYQQDYSKKDPSLYDIDARTVKAKKIFSVIEDFSSKEPGSCMCLDIGCSAGINTNFLAANMKDCVGMDIDEPAVKTGYSRKKPNGEFIIGDSAHLPFKNNTYDIVICNHVYEHVPDANRLMDEISRILKPGGFCYFGAGNRFCVIEPHYRLPFLSWFPKPVANFYLFIMKRERPYYENLRSYFGIKKLVGRFSLTDYTIKIIEDPERFYADDVIGQKSMIRKIPLVLIKILEPFIPTYIFILSKPESRERSFNENSD
jgi:SAM-dependent methyltransferase